MKTIETVLFEFNYILKNYEKLKRISVFQLYKNHLNSSWPDFITDLTRFLMRNFWEDVLEKDQKKVGVKNSRYFYREFETGIITIGRCEHYVRTYSESKKCLKISKIVINNNGNYTLEQFIFILLHELAHHTLWVSQVEVENPHGKEFQEENKRLIKKVQEKYNIEVPFNMKNKFMGTIKLKRCFNYKIKI